MTKHSSLIDALLTERAGYVQRGLKDRVAQIDTCLRDLGYQTKQTTTPVETATAVPQVETAALPQTRTRKKG
jgi:hypothetical protein